MHVGKMKTNHCIHVDPIIKVDDAAWEIEQVEAQKRVLEMRCAQLRHHVDEEIEKGLRFKRQRDFLLDWIGERFGASEQEAARAGVRGDWMGQESKAQKEWIGSPSPPVKAVQHCPSCGSFNIERCDIITIDVDCWRCKDCKCTWDAINEEKPNDLTTRYLG